MRRLLLLFWLCAAPLLAVAQDYQAPEVQVSTEKVKIGEKLFLVHKVLPKQTVFSICKAYGITADELKVANPDLKDGLKAGSILYIPRPTFWACAEKAAVSIRAMAINVFFIRISF